MKDRKRNPDSRKNIVFNIQSIILSVLMAISLVTIIVMGLLLYHRFKLALEKTAVDNTEATVEATVDRLNADLLDIRQILNGANYNVVQQFDISSREFSEQFSLLYETNSDKIQSLALYDPKGNLIASEPVAAEKKNVKVQTQEWYKNAEDAIENIHFSTPHIQELFEDGSYRYQWVVSLSRYVDVNKGETPETGILLLDMKYSVIRDVMKQINDCSGGIYYYLISQDGEMIYHPRGTELNRGLFEENSLETAKYEDGTYEIHSNSQNETVIVGSVAYTGWKMIGVVPESVQAANYKNFRYYVFATVLVLMVMLLEGNQLVSRKISKPIRELDASVKTYEAGGKPDIYIGGSSEIRHLGHSVQKSYEQIEELKANAENINYDVAKEREKVCRHDVMSHVYAYGVQCPKAKGIIHLGATSCYVGDNTDIIVMNEALKLVKKKLVNVIAELAKFADTYKDQPTLAFTHFQPAQPTTVGKRATLWMQEFLMDLEDLEYVQSTLKLLGSKGTTGTQASFLELFDGDQETIDKIDPMIAEKMGFKNCYPVSGQTYSRKVDTRVLNVLAGIAASATKFSNDIRLLQHLKEVEEPFEKGQIGSSAMAYKRNPMRSERIASLSRYVITDALNPAITSSVQWFERTLDDSANKRLSIPEGFLAIDGILDLCMNVVDGLVVYPKVILKHMMAELPFMATENIMMDAVKAGGDRQELHERIRELSMIAGKHVKEEGRDNDLLDLIAADEMFHLTKEELEKTMDPSKYTGRASVQVDAFLKNVVNPVLEANKEALGMTAEINV